MECAACGFVHYANSAPTATAFVLDGGGNVLLARRAYEPYAGLWDAPGGFLEEGEHPLAGLHRELREETGLTVDVGEFLGIHMDTYGPEPSSPSVLNLVWEARVTAGRPAPADDVSELRWFPLESLPADREIAFHWLGPALRAWAASRLSDPYEPKGRKPALRLGEGEGEASNTSCK